MKKKTIMIIAVVLLLVIGALIIIFLLNNSDKTFSLEDKYYGTSEIIKIDVETLSELIDSKGSFALFVSQEMCLASSDFEIVLNEFLEENPLTIYEINFSELTASELGDFLEYYPSFVLYKEGKVIDYLDANADVDLAYYQTSSGFKSWFTTYVNLERMNDNTITNENTDHSDKDTTSDIEETPTEEESIVNEGTTSNLDYITREEGKVNIYFFWGDGCPHCEEEFAFFESIENEYGDYYNLYTFETWKNKENAKLLEVFAAAMEVNTRGVPYTIIGEEVIIGFSESKESDFIDAILEAKDKSFDVYFDKIVE